MPDEDAFAERVQSLTAERDEAIATRESFRKLEAESFQRAEALQARVKMLQEALAICRETESDF